MSVKPEKKRKLGGRGGSRIGRAGRGAQSAAGSEAEEASLLSSALEPEPEVIREEYEQVPELPEIGEGMDASTDVKPLFLSRAMLTGLADSTWTTEHDAVLERFAQDPSEPVLTIFVDPICGLKLELGMPVQVGTPLPGSPPGAEGAFLAARGSRNPLSGDTRPPGSRCSERC